MKYVVFTNHKVKLFNDIESAFKFAFMNLYMSTNTKKELMQKLSLGEDITYSYGFNTSSIYLTK